MARLRYLFDTFATGLGHHERFFWLTDDQMARLRPYFPKSHGKLRVDDRRVLSVIIFVYLRRLGAALQVRTVVPSV